MVKIHPTAVVEKDVQLDADVVIGPHCVVKDNASLGAGTVLDAHVVIDKNVAVGQGNRFYPHCVIGCCPQVLGMNPDSPMGGLVIGDRNTIRENVTIHASRYDDAVTEIGNDNLIMVGSHIGHDCLLGDKIVLSNHVQIGGHGRIETGAWLSGMAGTHQFVTVGRWCFVAGLAGLNRDVPPFFIVSGHYPPEVRGVNKRGLIRAGLSAEQQERINEAYRALYRQGGALLSKAQELAQREGLDENVKAILDAIFKSSQHQFGRYQETLRRS